MRNSLKILLVLHLFFYKILRTVLIMNKFLWDIKRMILILVNLDREGNSLETFCFKLSVYLFRSLETAQCWNSQVAVNNCRIQHLLTKLIVFPFIYGCCSAFMLIVNLIFDILINLLLAFGVISKNGSTILIIVYWSLCLNFFKFYVFFWQI
jgi:hypothetical protein